jgi:hypothetical protein
VGNAACRFGSREGRKYSNALHGDESFKGGDFKAIGERFRRSSRMLPEGVIYHASSIDSANFRCFQIMEAPVRELLVPWIAAWHDLVAFEVVPVQTSAEFWARVQRQR